MNAKTSGTPVTAIAYGPAGGVKLSVNTSSVDVYLGSEGGALTLYIRGADGRQIAITGSKTAMHAIAGAIADVATGAR